MKRIEDTQAKIVGKKISSSGMSELGCKTHGYGTSIVYLFSGAVIIYCHKCLKKRVKFPKPLFIIQYDRSKKTIQEWGLGGTTLSLEDFRVHRPTLEERPWYIGKKHEP